MSAVKHPHPSTSEAEAFAGRRPGRSRRDGPNAATMPKTGQQGQTVPLAAGVITLIAVMAAALVSMGSRLVDATRASTAADAAALAAVAASPDRARAVASTIAEHNGARLVGLRWEHGDVIVEVRSGNADAQARGRLVVCGTPHAGCSS